MNSSINQVLAELLASNQLTTYQDSVIAAHLAKEKIRKEKARKAKARKYQMFHADLAEVLRLNPHKGFTTTEIQLLLPNAIRNRVSSQRVYSHLAMMLDENFGINSCEVWLCEGYCPPRVATLWYTGDLVTYPSIRENDNRPVVYRDFDFWQEVVSQ